MNTREKYRKSLKFGKICWKNNKKICRFRSFNVKNRKFRTKFKYF